MRLITRWVAAVTATALPGIIWPGISSANPACPLNTLGCSRYGFSSTDSVTSFSTIETNASYDLIGGAFHVFSRASCAGDCAEAASVSAGDSYRVEGLPAGTPLTFTAELAIQLMAGGGYGILVRSSTASATLREGVSNESSASVSTLLECYPGYGCSGYQVDLNRVLAVTVVRTAGEVFPLDFNLWTRGNTEARANGQLRFSGLPAGASVVSCQGFHQDFATLSRASTWGQLKVRYR
jgi:hypothetical protein